MGQSCQMIPVKASLSIFMSNKPGGLFGHVSAAAQSASEGAKHWRRAIIQKHVVSSPFLQGLKKEKEFYCHVFLDELEGV